MKPLNEASIQLDSYIDNVITQFNVQAKKQPKPTKKSALFQSKACAFDGQSIYYMQNHNQKFTLLRMQLESKQSENIELKFVNQFNESEIDMSQYDGFPFDIEVSNQTIVLMIKSIKQKSQFSQPIIQDIFKGILTNQNVCIFNFIPNLHTSIQANIHQYNSQLICILSTTKDESKLRGNERDQIFSVYSINNILKAEIKLNLTKLVKQPISRFCFSQENDQNRCFVYFATQNGQIKYVNLLLDRLLINQQTLIYLQQHDLRGIPSEQIAQKQYNQIYLQYSKSLYDPNKAFQNIQLYQMKKDQGYCTLLTKLAYKFDMFLQIFKLQNQNLRIIVIMSNGLQAGHVVYDQIVQFDQLPKKPSSTLEEHELEQIINFTQPQLLKQNMNLMQHSEYQWNISFRANVILSYRNCFLIIDYSNLFKDQVENSINVSCFNISPLENNGKWIDLLEQQISLIEALIIQYQNIKTIIIHRIQNGNHNFIQLNWCTLDNFISQSEGTRFNQVFDYKIQNQYKEQKEKLQNIKWKLEKYKQDCNSLGNVQQIEDFNKDLQQFLISEVNPIAEYVTNLYEQSYNQYQQIKNNSEILKLNELNKNLDEQLKENNENIYEKLNYIQEQQGAIECIKEKQKFDQLKEIDDQQKQLEQQLIQAQLKFDQNLQDNFTIYNKQEATQRIHDELISRLVEIKQKIQQ